MRGLPGNVLEGDGAGSDTRHGIDAISIDHLSPPQRQRASGLAWACAPVTVETPASSVKHSSRRQACRDSPWLDHNRRSLLDATPCLSRTLGQHVTFAAGCLRHRTSALDSRPVDACGQVDKCPALLSLVDQRSAGTLVQARAVLAEDHEGQRVPDKANRTSVELFATRATSGAAGSLRRRDAPTAGSAALILERQQRA